MSPGAPAVTTGGRDEVEPVVGLFLAGIIGLEVTPELLPDSGSAADEAVWAESWWLSTIRVLVTGTTVKIWAETPFMMVWMVVGTVTSVKVVDGMLGFPWSSFGLPV